MNRWRKSIGFKLFLITSGLLVIFAVLIYFAIYLLLPSFYYQYKISNLNEQIEELITGVEQETLMNSIVKLDDFSETNNVEAIIFDSDGQIVYLPPSVSRFFIGNGQLIGRRLVVAEASDSGNLFLQTNNSEIRVIEEPISFEGTEYTIRVVVTLQPIDEAAHVIFRFTPYIVMIIFIFAMIAALIYSRITTKPLLHMNKVAKRMTNLDFSETCSVTSQDEIGELSQSLNEMSQNLQETMCDLQTANDQLKDEIQRERELEAKRREFVATISHELKSPITAVMGQIEAMIHEIGPYKDRDKYLRRSYSIMSDMEGLVKEVLEISQLEQYDFEPKLETVNLKNLIENCMKKFEYFYQTKQVNMEVTLEEVSILADKNLMEKAIGNVINNAIKYSPEGAKVIITLKNEKNKPVLTVFNSGVYIEEKELANVFQAFYRIEKSRNRDTGGSGLGLYIVQKILELHNAEYDIQNKQDGVEFTMRF